MAFPQYTSATNTTWGSASASPSINMPATVSAGDLLLMFVGVDDIATFSATGWSVIDEASTAGVILSAGLLAKVAVGTEGGGTVTLNLSASRVGSARVLRYTDWHGTLADLGSGNWTGLAFVRGTLVESNTVTYPELTAPWGSDDNAWIAAYAGGDDDDEASEPSSPTNYLNGGSARVNAGANLRFRCFTATRELATATEQPGTSTIPAAESERTVPWTIVVRPASASSITGAGAITLPSLAVAATGTSASAPPAPFPQHASATNTSLATASSSHAVNMPATVSAGDLLVMLLAFDQSPGTVASSGWSTLATKDNAAGFSFGGVLAKVAAGTEGGGTATVTCTIAQEGCARVLRITDWHGTLADLGSGDWTGVAISSVAEGDNVNTVNTASLTAPWGSANTLWISAFTSGDDTSTVPSAPADYLQGGGATLAAGSNLNFVAATAVRERTVATEDPGAWGTLAATEHWQGWTIAVRPASGSAPPAGEVSVVGSFTDSGLPQMVVSFTPNSTANPHNIYRADDSSGSPGTPEEPFAFVGQVEATTDDPATFWDQSEDLVTGQRVHYTVREVIAGTPQDPYTSAAGIVPGSGGSAATVSVTTAGGGSKIALGGSDISITVTVTGGGQKISETRPTYTRKGVGNASYSGPGARGFRSSKLITGQVVQHADGGWAIEDNGTAEAYVVDHADGGLAVDDAAVEADYTLRRVSGNTSYNAF